MTTTTTYLSCAETAKLLRKALKSAFPGVKFSVRSERGSAINVTWTDGPRESDVRVVAQRYKGGRFDPMIDLAYHAAHALNPATGEVRLLGTYGHSFDNEPLAEVPDGWVPVSFGADFVFVERNLSPAYWEVLTAAAEEAVAAAGGWEALGESWHAVRYVPTKYAGHALEVHSPAALIRALSQYVAPDGTPYEEE